MRGTVFWLVAVATPGIGTAQQVAADGRVTFERPFFDRFAPANALEVVSRTPGFVLEQPDESVRGFANAAGNVVIDGQRPSAKSDTLETILQRIPADQVVRVELASGDLFGAEFRGRPQVLNLVLKRGGGLSGSYTASLIGIAGPRVEPEGQASLAWKRGSHSVNASLAYDNFPSREEGEDFVRALPSGALLERRDKTNLYGYTEAKASAAWEWSAGDVSYRLNGRLSRDAQPLFQKNDVQPVGAPLRRDTLQQSPHRVIRELGGDTTRPLAGGQAKLIALVTRRHVVNHDVLTSAVGTPALSGLRQAIDSRSGETILRGTWSRTMGQWTIEAGGEGALNRLASDVALTTFGPSGNTKVDLPVDDVTVKEQRAEGFVAASRDLAKGLRANVLLGFETSHLTVAGDANAARTLRFAKPKLSLDWTASKRLRVQTVLERKIGQLDFDDFVSTAEVASDRVNAGNAELQPERTWRLEITVQRRILGDGLAKLVLGWDEVSAVEDRVPTLDGFDAPGNLGHGRRQSAQLSLDASLGSFGFSGGRLTVDGYVQRSSVTDPNDGRHRRFSDETPWRLEVGLRQDLPAKKMGWGLTYDLYGDNISYRRDEIDNRVGRFDDLRGFAEYRASKLVTARLEIRNLLNGDGRRDRTFFRDRRLGPFQSEERVRRQQQTMIFTVKGSF